MFGGVLLSHTLPCAVPSALNGLTSGFGMGPGVSLFAMATDTPTPRLMRVESGNHQPLWEVGGVSLKGYTPARRVCVVGYLTVNASITHSVCKNFMTETLLQKKEDVVCVASPRPISIGQLHTLLRFHVRPINPVVCRGPYHLMVWESSS